ncbi:MAG: hypothetical protein JWM59_4265 [Verrucomicrobiales bacterium]|nr:hypothetical protein [Verrucomicrobiales bacterium]
MGVIPVPRPPAFKPASAMKKIQRLNGMAGTRIPELTPRGVAPCQYGVGGDCSADC